MNDTERFVDPFENDAPEGPEETLFDDCLDDGGDMDEDRDEDEMDDIDDSMDGDAESALASCGWGTDEDYGGSAYDDYGGEY